MARRFAYVLIWLALTAEVEGFIFENNWYTPLTWLGTKLFTGMPTVHLIPWDVMVIVTLLVARGGKRTEVPLVARSIKISFLALAALWLWGIINHGSAYQTIWQLHPFVMGLFVALMVTATCRTTAHVRSLGKVVVFAAIYRECILLLFYQLVAKDLPDELPTLTDHCDSVLFVSGLFILLAVAVERRTFGAIARVVPMAVLTIVAVALNKRRIAWLDLGIGLVLMYIMLPKGRQKSRITRWLIYASPLIAAYIAAGWGHPTGVFKPVGSISTMFGSNQDVSSIMRDIENYNLTKTLKTNPLLGVGWGNKYVEEIAAYDISAIFPQYRYLPHNSLLGVLAFTGMLGFAGIWQMLPVASFLHARVYWNAQDQTVRIAALSSILTFMIVIIQMWGDVGFNHLMVNTMMGVGVGLSARLPVMAGLWPGPQPATQLSQARNDVHNH